MQSAQVAEKYGFTDIRHALFHRMRTFSAKEYIELLGTYSDHIAIEETIRTEFFSKIEETINMAAHLHFMIRLIYSLQESLDWHF